MVGYIWTMNIAAFLKTRPVGMARTEAVGATLIILLLFVSGCKSTVESPNARAPAVSNTGDIKKRLPVLFLVGDSTVHTGGVRRGWGDEIGQFFDPTKITVTNCARGGRSSRAFQTQGWWSNLLACARPRDFVLIQFGHNDGGPLDDTNRARGTIRGLRSESQEIYNPIMHKEETVHTYGWYMSKYIADARARYLTPIICSPVPRVPKQAADGTLIDKDPYVEWSAQVADNQRALFIDLHRIIMAHYAGKSPEEIRARYFTKLDHTHTNPTGAKLNAESVVEGLRKLTNCPLRNFLLEKPTP